MKDKNDSVLIITYMDNENRLFSCAATPGRAYRVLYEKLGNSSYQSIHKLDDWDHWIFLDKRDEESFLEAFKWFIIERE